MKYMIASDLHGSALFCRKMLERLQEEQAQRLVLLGDLLYHGPRNDLPEGYAPKEVISLLNGVKEKIFCVRGNCDTEVDQMVLEFPILAESLLLEAKGHLIFATHGHRYHLDAPPHLNQGDILLYGHTHIPACEQTESFVYLNPGSVSIPKEGSRHSYMILQDGVFTWKDLDGNAYRTFEIAE
jgi:putative phosphoesterase